MGKYTLEIVLNKIHKLHDNYPPHNRSPKIKKRLEELYNLEHELMKLKEDANIQKKSDNYIKTMRLHRS